MEFDKLEKKYGNTFTSSIRKSSDIFTENNDRLLIYRKSLGTINDDYALFYKNPTGNCQMISASYFEYLPIDSKEELEYILKLVGIKFYKRQFLLDLTECSYDVIQPWLEKIFHNIENLPYINNNGNDMRILVLRNFKGNF